MIDKEASVPKPASKSKAKASREDDVDMED